MKSIIYILFMFTVLQLQNCTTQTYLDTATLQKVIAERNFTFMAQKANPSNFYVINIANSIPNYGAGKMLNLDHGYTLVLKENELVVTLPYFGRSFVANMNNDQGYKFTTQQFITEEITSKKGRKTIKILLKDQRNINAIYIEIYPNGRTSVSIDSNDRQPISYDGYLMENEEQ